MNRLSFVVAGLVVGVAFGWYLAYRASTPREDREALRGYLDGVKQQDEKAAAIGLATLVNLERGDTNGAEWRLRYVIASYYRLYHGRGGNTNLLAQIEAASQRSPHLAAEIARKSE